MFVGRSSMEGNAPFRSVFRRFSNVCSFEQSSPLNATTMSLFFEGTSVNSADLSRARKKSRNSSSSPASRLDQQVRNKGVSA